MRSIIIPAPDQDRGPCVPAALSIILDVTFDQINRWLVYRGYRNKRTKGIGRRHCYLENTYGSNWIVKDERFRNDRVVG